MNRILDYIIKVLILILIIIVIIVVYRIITFQKHTIYFDLNGSTSIEKSEITCDFSLHGCVIELPNVQRNDGVILGYSLNKDDTKATYNIGNKVLINEDKHLFAISYQEFVVNISKNDVDYLEKDHVSCLAYNENKTCKVTLPNFNKIGYQLVGYSTNPELSKTMNSYFQNETYEIDGNMALYPNYAYHVSNFTAGHYIMKDDVYTVNNSFVEFNNTCSQDVVDTYKKIVDDINKNAPYLFVGTKLNVLTNDTFLSRWGGGGNILGVNYHSVSDDYPLSRSLDLLSSSGKDLMDKYKVVVHEMGHSFDFYYGYGINRPKTLSSDYSPNKGNQSISAQSDIKSLFKKYCSMPAYNRPLRDYAYTEIQEFTAEAITYYYLKFIVPTGEYQSAYYPDDLKTTIEKYFCIAKNNYNVDGC